MTDEALAIASERCNFRTPQQAVQLHETPQSTCGDWVALMHCAAHAFVPQVSVASWHAFSPGPQVKAQGPVAHATSASLQESAFVHETSHERSGGQRTIARLQLALPSQRMLQRKPTGQRRVASLHSSSLHVMVQVPF